MYKMSFSTCLSVFLLLSYIIVLAHSSRKLTFTPAYSFMFTLPMNLLTICATVRGIPTTMIYRFSLAVVTLK